MSAIPLRDRQISALASLNILLTDVIKIVVSYTTPIEHLVAICRESRWAKAEMLIWSPFDRKKSPAATTDCSSGSVGGVGDSSVTKFRRHPFNQPNSFECGDCWRQCGIVNDILLYREGNFTRELTKMSELIRTTSDGTAIGDHGSAKVEFEFKATQKHELKISPMHDVTTVVRHSSIDDGAEQWMIASSRTVQLYNPVSGRVRDIASLPPDCQNSSNMQLFSHQHYVFAYCQSIGINEATTSWCHYDFVNNRWEKVVGRRILSVMAWQGYVAVSISYGILVMARDFSMAYLLQPVHDTTNNRTQLDIIPWPTDAAAAVPAAAGVAATTITTTAPTEALPFAWQCTPFGAPTIAARPEDQKYVRPKCRLVDIWSLCGSTVVVCLVEPDRNIHPNRHLIWMDTINEPGKWYLGPMLTSSPRTIVISTLPDQK